MAAPDTPFHFAAPPHVIPHPSMTASFKVDEGFSEDSRSQMGSDMDTAPEPAPLDDAYITSARDWLLTLPVDVRADLARNLLASLSNPIVADIVAEANQRLHFDPVQEFPQEIISQIFEHFDPLTLYHASLVNSTWNAKAKDFRLWRRLFSLEGWTYDKQAIRTLAQTAEKLGRPSSKRTRRPVSIDAGPEDHSIKRLRESGMQPSSRSNLLQPWQDQNTLVEADGSIDAQAGSLSLQNTQSQDLDMPDRDALAPVEPPTRNPFISVDEATGESKPNWHYIFQQRRRLEGNWLAGRFKNFSLPHKDAMHQAHTQCVYTLQYSNRYVVSGSRDRSVRVWDLETQELKMPPLEGLDGHRGSVLCLQFDERPEQDVIISGGSDSDVIVWQFSTGKVIKRLTEAHTESVLNLRFDERYLVTCSKDKSIKVWNRKELRPTDVEYPDKSQGRDARYPKHIINIPELVEDQFGKPIHYDPLAPYSELMTLVGHGAAVNAIQIYQDEIVSASGDRKIMLWNIKKGTLTRTFTGHSKGIACVQYDGRRIVSGSSDNSVRIFDSSTAAEVAYLDGHRNLVRTVQAEFGDLPGDAEVLEAEARENDRRLVANHRDRRRVTRSSPFLQRYFVYGAKLPPGGGGNKWSKIVSGSYDETVIIWRRDREGRWYIAKELRQEDAMRASAGMPRSGGSSARQQTPVATPPTQQSNAVAAPSNQVQRALSQPATGSFSVSATLNAAGGIEVASQLQPTTSPTQRPPGAPRPPVSAPFTPIAQAPAPQVTTHHAHGQPATSTHLQPTMAQNALQNTNPHHHHHHTHHHHHPNFPHGVAPHPHVNHGGLQGANAAALHHHHHHHHPPLTQAQREALAQQGLNSRVFKLQFDARRIICCSQEPVIVGWDFANGDEAIMEASQYFGEPS